MVARAWGGVCHFDPGDVAGGCVVSTLRDIAREYKLSWEALRNLDSDDPGYEAANLRWEEALRAYQSTPESWSARAAFTLDSLDCEVRQTRRQMIAALYYCAGLAELESRRPLQSIHDRITKEHEHG